MEESSRTVQYWASLAVGMYAVAFSASFSWPTPVIPKFHNNETDISITDTEISWVIVSASPGIILGTILSQYLSDILGRRTTLLASTLPFCVGTMLIMFATKVWMLYIARFFWGLGSGFGKIVSTIYLAEIASKEIRGRLVVNNRFMFNLGNLLVVVIGTSVSFHTLNYLFIILPVACFFACWWIPETPYYLLKKNKVDNARKALKKLNGYSNKTILEQKLSEMRKHVKEDMQRSTTIKELFTGKRYRKALLIAFGLRIFHALSGVIPTQQYLGGVMQETDSSVSISTALILFNSLKFFTSMMSSVIVDRVGRRPLLMFSYAGAFLSFTLIGTCFFLQEVIIIEKFPNLFGNLIFSGVICFCIFSTIGFDTLINVVPGEIFPLNIKSLAMTCTNLFGSLVAVVTTRGYQIVKDLSGLYGVFWFYGTSCLVGALFVYFVVPETKGKSLRDIQIMLQGSHYEVECGQIDLAKKNDGQARLIPANEEKEAQIRIVGVKKYEL